MLLNTGLQINLYMFLKKHHSTYLSLSGGLEGFPSWGRALYFRVRTRKELRKKVPLECGPHSHEGFNSDQPVINLNGLSTDDVNFHGVLEDKESPLNQAVNQICSATPQIFPISLMFSDDQHS